MPYTVSGCFEKFRKEVVDLDSDQTSVARSSRDFVLENIDRLSSLGDIPLVADCYCLNFGSFARNTKIRPLDDIDMMVCYNGNGGVYDTIQQNNLYHIRFADNHPFFDYATGESGVTITKEVVLDAAKKVYKDYPEFYNIVKVFLK